MGLVYLDTCVIIESVEKPTEEGQAVVELITNTTTRMSPFRTSELTLLETLVVPIREVDQTAAWEGFGYSARRDWYRHNLVEDGVLIRTIPITRDILIQAAAIRARVRSIKTPDAIHLATALLSGCEHFVTADTELRRKVTHDPSWLHSQRKFAFVELTVPALAELRSKLLA